MHGAGHPVGRYQSGNGHTLEAVIPEIESLTGATLKRILAAAGYNFRLIFKWIRLLSSLIRLWMAENSQTRPVQIAA